METHKNNLEPQQISQRMKNFEKKFETIDLSLF